MANVRRLRQLTGVGLALMTIVSRVPFVSKTFFEFDSIDFAVASTRFSLEQVTPHIPGYMLHILLGRLFYALLGNLNTAYVSLSIVLSTLAVLALWRAAAELRGERVGLIAALLWITTPLFWFQGEVATTYVYDALFTSLALLIGLSAINSERFSRKKLCLFAAVLALSIGARQSSLLFLVPSLIYLIYKSRPRSSDVFLACFVTLIVSSLWAIPLLHESGGLQTYLHFASLQDSWKTQSVLFGNSIESQLSIIAKVLFYLPISLSASIIIFLVGIFRWRSSLRAIRTDNVTKLWFILWTLIPPLIFYFVIYFMKAAYLLNILPGLILIAAVLLDDMVIAIARRIKLNSHDRLQLTRPIITRTALLLTSIVVAINCLWYLLPLPGTGLVQSNDENTRNSFVKSPEARLQESNAGLHTVLNRAFAYTNVHAIEAVDEMNDRTFKLLRRTLPDSNGVLLTTWWSRWAYAELPTTNVYDVELAAPDLSSFEVGLSRNEWRTVLRDSVIRLSGAGPVIVLVRHDRPDFVELSSQVQLERLPLPEYLDAYRISDPSFRIQWRNKLFVREQ